MKRAAHTLTTVDDLAAHGLVLPDDTDGLAAVADRYAVAVTPAMAELAHSGSAGVRAQFIPDGRELATHPAELADPIGDAAHSPVTGIVHRHPDRVLLKIVGVCPIYCRFCFRREMIGPGEQAVLANAEIDAALGYIARYAGIWEVILTGGDPLVLSPRRIGDLMRRLDQIGHVKVVRWHTRVPVVAPERINADLVEALRTTDKTVCMAVHANHADELTSAARAALARLADAGIALLSQTVLLRGVNDDVETLEHLLRRFVESRVKPYYLHHGDLAPGTSHFRTSIRDGLAIVAQLGARLSGLCHVVYVVDLPVAGKVALSRGNVVETAPGRYRITDPQGCTHDYVDMLEDTARERA